MIKVTVTFKVTVTLLNLIYHRCFDRKDRRQKVRQHFPAITRVAAVEQLPGVGAHIDARVLESVGRHGLAQHDQGCGLLILLLRGESIKIANHVKK